MVHCGICTSEKVYDNVFRDVFVRIGVGGFSWLLTTILAGGMRSIDVGRKTRFTLS